MHYSENNEFSALKIYGEIQAKVIFNGLPERVAQVLVNLLENAISFARPIGEIKVKLSKTWRKGIVLSIEDSGPGIRPELTEIIFDRFYTSRHGGAVEENASGLGLAICKQVIEAHGGKIEVSKSDLGGAKFTITV